MIVHEVAQGSADWWRLRIGIPTASAMDQILSSSRSWYLVSYQSADEYKIISRHTREDTAMKASETARKKGVLDNGAVVSRFDASGSQQRYLNHLLAEWCLQSPIDEYQSREMERGQDLEPEAQAYYEMHTGYDCLPGGFITNDEATMGCSPDLQVIGAFDAVEGGRLVGGVEIKCPSPATHMAYARGTKSVQSVYKHQVQACMLITGAQWWDVLSYFPHPCMPPVIERAHRDEEYLAALEPELHAFISLLASERERLGKLGYGPKS